MSMSVKQSYFDDLDCLFQGCDKLFGHLKLEAQRFDSDFSNWDRIPSNVEINFVDLNFFGWNKLTYIEHTWENMLVYKVTKLFDSKKKLKK